jgi:hypothetical protein
MKHLYRSKLAYLKTNLHQVRYNTKFPLHVINDYRGSKTQFYSSLPSTLPLGVSSAANLSLFTPKKEDEIAH